MAEDTYQEDQDMMKMDFSDLNRGRSSRSGRSEKKPSDPEKGKKFLVFGGVMLCVVILIIVIIFVSGDKSGNQPVSPIQTRIKGLEETVGKFQGQQEALEKSIAKLEGSLNSLRGDLRKVSRQVEQLNKRTTGVTKQAKKTVLVPKKAASQTRRHSHVVQKGESLYKIAKKYGISLRDLYRLNSLTSKSVIYPGQKLLVGPAGKK